MCGVYLYMMAGQARDLFSQMLHRLTQRGNSRVQIFQDDEHREPYFREKEGPQQRKGKRATTPCTNYRLSPILQDKVKID